MPKIQLFIKSTVETVIYFVIILLAVLLVQRYLIQPVLVKGYSMQNTLSDGDCLLVDKISIRFNELKRFDIIVFEPSNEPDDYIKRVIGLPGETVQIKDNLIYINGSPLMENYGKENVIYYNGIATQEVVLGKGEYFVLGDNRNDSKDSRDSSVGVVSRESIWGKAVFRIWPFRAFGNIG